MAWPAVGVVGGGEASAAAQPATGGRSRRHDRRCFGRLEQEDQRLKKHYGRWMEIVRSVELESCILTKLTKPLVPVNLVGPLYWVPASRGSIHFLCVIRRHFLACEDIAGGSLLSSSPRTVISLFLSVVDDTDNARGRRTERTEAMDDDEAPDWNDPGMGKTRQWMPTRRGV